MFGKDRKFLAKSGFYIWFFLPILLVISLLGVGFLISQVGDSFHKNNRHLIVKGLAEQEVLADLAIWKISFTTSGKDLGLIGKKSTQTQQAITQFLKKQGFTENEMENGDFWIGTNSSQDSLITYTGSIIVRTSSIQKVQTANKNIYSIIKGGFLVSSDNPRYIFNKVNNIKPQLLSVALDNARKTAYIFAKNSHTKIGKVRYAHQGVISIVARDIQTSDSWTEQKSPNKIVRMVITVDYNLI